MPCSRRHRIALAFGTLASILGVCFSIAACKRLDDQSKVLVTNGIDADGEYPAVVRLKIDRTKTCTGTFVSDTTLITAAHCIVGDVAYDGVRPVSTLVNPRYVELDQHDLAVLIFPSGTAPASAELLARRPVVGDRLTIVGYGAKDAAAGTGVGIKRRGNNVIADLVNGEIIFVGQSKTANGQDPTGEQAASASGDSGGPLFIDDRLAGVTSSGYVTGDRKRSFYVDLHNASAQALMRDAVAKGAKIAGFGDASTNADQAKPAAGGTMTAPTTAPTSAPANDANPTDRLDELDRKPCISAETCGELLSGWRAEQERLLRLLGDALSQPEARNALSSSQIAWNAYQERDLALIATFSVADRPHLNTLLAIDLMRLRTLELSNQLSSLAAGAGIAYREADSPLDDAPDQAVEQCLAAAGKSDDCLAQGKIKWEDAIVRVHSALRSRLDAGAQRLLDDAQLAWTEFDGQEATLYRHLAAIGTGKVPTAAAELWLSKARTAMLQRYLDWFNRS